MQNTFQTENKYAPCISDNADLRVILSILYTILEVIRMYDTEIGTNQQFANVNRQEFDSKYVYLKKELKQELSKQ